MSEKIAKLFYRFAEGDISLIKLHKMATEMGLKSQDGNKPISYNSFRHILEHPVYAGYSKPGKLLKEPIRLRFDGLVDKDTFDRVQVLLSTGKQEPKLRNKELYPLDGTISRAECAINDKKQRALDSFLEGKISQEEKDGYTKNLDARRLELKERRMAVEKQQMLNETTIEYVCNLMDKPAKLWRDADLDTKRAFQRMLFPNGLHIDIKTKKCRTEDLSPLYSVIRTKKEPEGPQNADMVTSAGVEPALTG